MTNPHQASSPTDHNNHEEHVRKLVHFFETLTHDNATQVAAIYAPDAQFKDPFNAVEGLPAIQHLFAHMFKQVKNPRFTITDTVRQNEQVFLTWDFFFHMPPYAAAEQCIRGATHFRLADDGRVLYHRDYWDAAEELYEKLPLVGLFMRGLKSFARQ